MSEFTGAELIVVERIRQVEEEGYDAVHDREHVRPLTRAAACYALGQEDRDAHLNDMLGVAQGWPPALWPWALRFWKPTPEDRVRELVKAGALIAAAIDSLLLEKK